MIVLLIGPPGAGKGTQAARLSRQYKMYHLSTGDMFRDISANPKTELEQEVKDILNRGDLIPDDLTINLVKEKMTQPECAHGVILDGFPRTVAQAEELDKTLEGVHKPLDHVFLLEVDEDTLVERKAGRLYAPKSKKVYHAVHNPPKVAGKCDETGEDLIHREDDKPAATRHRLQVYREQTAPVVDYYDTTGRVKRVDGMGNMDDVFAALRRYIEG